MQNNYSGSTAFIHNHGGTTFEASTEEDGFPIWAIAVIGIVLLLAVLTLIIAILYFALTRIIAQYRNIRNGSKYNEEENSNLSTSSSNDGEIEVLSYYRFLESRPEESSQLNTIYNYNNPLYAGTTEEQENSQLNIIYNPLNTGTAEEPPDYDAVVEVDLPSYEDIMST